MQLASTFTNFDFYASVFNNVKYLAVHESNKAAIEFLTCSWLLSISETTC